jgi:hypothetical protein
MKLQLSLLVAALALSGCREDRVTSPRDLSPPAAPRGVVSVTGDHQVTVSWVDNTEGDLSGYRVYESPCSSGPSCPYDLVGTTAGTSFVVSGLANGQTRYFAVAAFDRAGNESPLSYQDVFDTPRPAGFGVSLGDATDEPAISGWDFSAALRRAWDSGDTDMYFMTSGGSAYMVTPFADTDIQDAGYASTLDAVDFSPTSGWSPTGTVELIPGHNYIVWTFDDYYAKFRVTSIGSSPDRVVFDWAYQIDQSNRELSARRVRGEGPRVRRTITIAGTP